MEWTNDRVLALVRDYREHPVLWDSTSSQFKMKSRRDQAWEEIAANHGTDVNEIKKKMNSALASFRRERTKVLKSGSEFEEPYESRWFAFDSFQFLMDKFTPHVSIMEPMIESNYNVQEFDCSKIIKSELNEHPDDLEIHYATPIADTSVSIEQTTTTECTNRETDCSYKNQRLLPKRKYQYGDPRISSSCKIARKFNSEHEKRDECKAFSEYLVFKLRNYDDRTRSIVQHLINNTIFNADMGKYSKSETTKSDNSNKTVNSVLPDDKIVPQDIDYLQEISNIVSDGKHFLDV